jgi:hydroxymethylpyrimidine/phosphomethylpyrimidine kinase
MKLALTIAGSDSGGGAGIQADLKTFHQYGVFGTSVLVAITAQNTRGVSAIHAIPYDIVEAQIEALAGDLPPDAVKTGMLATADLVETVASAIQRHHFCNYVLDPVMVATSGDRLLDRDAERKVRELLVPIATVVTPNLDEATILVGDTVDSVDGMVRAGRELVRMGAQAALVKGGHLAEASLTDVLVTRDRVHHLAHPRIQTSSTHGTGCTLSAAIAAGLALDRGLDRSVTDALDFVHRAMVTAPGLGGGHGPLNHFVPPPAAG